MNAAFEPVLQSFMMWLWKTSLSATALIALVLLLEFLLRKWHAPQWRYGLWLLVVARLVMPLAPPTSFSIFNLATAFENRFSKPQSSHLPHGKSDPSSNSTLAGEGDAVTVANQTAQAAPPGLLRSELPLNRRMQSMSLPCLWLMGVGGYLLVILIQHHRLAAWVRRQSPVALPRLIASMESSRRLLGLKRKVRIIATTRLRTPAVFGFGKPCLLLPATMIEGLSDSEMRLVILHELVHVQRRDVLLNWLLILVQSLHWFNPAVWFALRRLRAERELVCDAVVLSHLTPTERTDYGNTLIKLLAYVSKPPLGQSLVPIINRNHQIQRRITMIAQFKSTPRLTTVVSTLLLLALAGFTLTDAAEKEAKLPERSRSDSETAKAREVRQQGIEILEKAMEKLSQQVRQTQEVVDKLREELIIPNDASENSGSSMNAEALRQLERLRIEAQAEYEQMNTLYTHLSKLSRPELRRAILTASPDTLLAELLNSLANCEQRLADSRENYDDGHPDVKRMKAVIAQVNSQINDRLDGILEGLKARTASLKAKLERLEAEVEKGKTRDIKTAIQSRPYFQAKRDLQNLQEVLDQLKRRVIQEKIELEIPKNP